MADKLYPNTGILFQKKRDAHERAPDLNGNIEVDMTVAEDIIRQITDGAPLAKIKIAFWEKQGRNGIFYGGKVDLSDGPSGRGGARQGGADAPMSGPKPADDIDDEIPF